MEPSTQPDRVRARMLAEAVDDNVRTIRDETAPREHPRRGHSVPWRTRLGVTMMPVALVMAAIGMARQSPGGDVSAPTAAAPAAMSSAPPATSSPRPGTATTAPAVDPAALAVNVDPDVQELKVRRVVLDAGHGGDNRGTASASGLEEKALTLDIARRTRELLAADGFEIVMTRTNDASLSLQERAAVANSARGDIFVSIHLNALRPTRAKGIETYYLGPSDNPEPDAIVAAENEHSGYSLSDLRSLLERIYADVRRDESRRLAQVVQLALVDRMRQVDPDLTDRGVKRAPFVVLVATDMPAILAEVASLSNAEEAERLGTDRYRQTLAEALATGIRTFARRRGTPDRHDE
ncbi:MAG: N-acetylmuramoyl-L-alanine amidase [Vicinamibacterales bacterium]